MAGMATTGRGPVAFPGGLLIMTGGEGGNGVKFVVEQTVGLEAGTGGGGAGTELGDGIGWRRGTVA